MAARSVTCPTCQRKVPWSDSSPFRPFCSERCRLIDLGAWVSEQRSIPGDESVSTDDEGPGLPPDAADDRRDPRH
jgi:endogenous inhibitor of DNA gyrase (YacG/DUF329 family)